MVVVALGGREGGHAIVAVHEPTTPMPSRPRQKGRTVYRFGGKRSNGAAVVRGGPCEVRAGDRQIWSPAREGDQNR